MISILYIWHIIAYLNILLINSQNPKIPFSKWQDMSKWWFEPILKYDIVKLDHFSTSVKCRKSFYKNIFETTKPRLKPLGSPWKNIIFISSSTFFWGGPTRGGPRKLCCRISSMTHAAPRLHLDSPVRVEKVDPTRWDSPPKKKTHQPKKKGGLEKTVGSIYVLYMYYYIIYYTIPNKKLDYISKKMVVFLARKAGWTYSDMFF